jgi:3-dehydroquinate synthase
MRIKADVVANDRFEAGRRELLNLGHTFAHGIEYASNYRISHGAAVAIGLRAAGLLAQKIHGYSLVDHQRTLALLARLRLPMHNETIVIDDVLAGMTSDKKARAGKLRFVLPRAIGAVDFGVTATAAQVRSVVKQILTPPAKREFGT